MPAPASDAAPVPFGPEQFVRALFNILEDSNVERQRLRETQSAIINILDDFSQEKVRIENSQRAVLNILEDSSEERDRLKHTQRAVINILEDSSEEKDRLRNTQRAVLNILDDISEEKERLQQTQRAVLNILEDFSIEKDRLNDTQRAVTNILDDLHGDNSQLLIAQEALVGITRDLEIRVQSRTKDLSIANIKLQSRSEELIKSSKYKSEFLANMSHELRTPLNSMLLLANLLGDNPDGRLSEKQVKFAKTIVASGKDLLALINDILDLSKVESGKMQIEAREVDLTALLERLRDTFTPLATQKQLQFTVDIAAGCPRAIITDGQRLDQILKNLLSNAIKFTNVGRVALKIRSVVREPTGPDSLDPVGRCLAFAVIDTGIGIPLDKQQQVFEAFQQADGSTSRKYGGTGLGLSISKAIAALLGGSIEIDSQPGHGSCFKLTIPERIKAPA